MKRQSKKEIREAIEKLKGKSTEHKPTPQSQAGKLAPKMSTQRIRKQGI